MAKAAPAAPKKPLTKTALPTNIAAATEVPKRQVAAVLDALAAEIKKSLGNKGAGVIALPGLVKIEKKKVPARRAQKGRDTTQVGVRKQHDWLQTQSPLVSTQPARSADNCLG